VSQKVSRAKASSWAAERPETAAVTVTVLGPHRAQNRMPIALAGALYVRRVVAIHAKRAQVGGESFG
jgi:hypothetical protein